MYAILFPAIQPTTAFPVDCVPSHHAFAKVMNDPATAALQACGTTKAATTDFRMPNEVRELETTLVETTYEV